MILAWASPFKVVSSYRNPQLQVGENYNSSLRVLGCHLPLRGLTLQQFIIWSWINHKKDNMSYFIMKQLIIMKS